MAASKPNNSKKFFDVAKPGKSMPSSSSRPTIIKSRAVLNAPIVGAEVSAGTITNRSAADDLPVSTTAPRIEPLSSAKSKAKSEKPAKSPADDQPASVPMPGVDDVPEVKKVDSAAADQVMASADEPAADNPPTEESSSTAQESATPDTSASATAGPTEAQTAEAPVATTDSIGDIDSPLKVAGLKTAAEKEAEKAQKEAEAKQQALEKLVDDKTYFVSIGDHKKKRSGGHHFLTFTFILLMLAALGYLAVDSGMIKTSVELPVRLFKTPE